MDAKAYVMREEKGGNHYLKNNLQQHPDFFGDGSKYNPFLQNERGYCSSRPASGIAYLEPLELHI
jgi:hypothetical protein